MVTVIVLVPVVQNQRPDALLVYETKFSNVLYAKNLAFFFFFFFFFAKKM